MKLRIKKLTDTAKLPTYGTDGAAGMDLYADEEKHLRQGEVALLHTGIAMEIPHGHVGLIVPRSGLSLRTSLRQPNCVGVIDEDYRGEVRGMFENTGCDVVKIDKGTRFAQMLVVPYVHCEVEEVDDLGETERGDGGFGSTGVK